MEEVNCKLIKRNTKENTSQCFVNKDDLHSTLPFVLYMFLNKTISKFSYLQIFSLTKKKVELNQFTHELFLYIVDPHNFFFFPTFVDFYQKMHFRIV